MITSIDTQDTTLASLQCQITKNMNNSATSPPIWMAEALLESWHQGAPGTHKRTIRRKYIEMFEHFEQVFEQLPNNDKQEGGTYYIVKEWQGGWTRDGRTVLPVYIAVVIQQE